MDMETSRAPRMTGPIIPGERGSQAIDSGEDRFSQLARFVGDIDVNRALEEATRVMQRYPLQVLVGGAALGYLIARWQASQARRP